MHPTALEGFERMVRAASLAREGARVLDVGGADVNGTAHANLREWIVRPRIDVLDIAEGPGVTIVGDATDPKLWADLRTMSDPYDLVISTETFEHVQDWENIVSGALSVLRPGGWFIGTCASVGRRPHGARGAHDPAPGEWYQNVAPGALIAEMLGTFRGDVVVEYSKRPEFPTTNDLYWRAQVAL